LVVITPSEELNSYYLAAIFNSAWGVASVGGNLVGVAQQHFNIGAARELEVSIPPRPVQNQIAGILSAYDDLMENNQRRIRILEEMARLIYREWFVDFKFPGHESSGFVESELGKTPRGWRAVNLGEIAEEIRRNVPKGLMDESRPYVGLEHIPRHKLALDAWVTSTDLGSNKLEFRTGEILFGKIRPYFHKVSIAPFDGVCSADTIVVGSRDHRHHALVAAVVSSDEFVAHATATSNGSKMPRANWSVLAGYRVLLPPENLLARFSDLFSNSVDAQQQLVFASKNLRRTRDLLLPRLMTGEIDVSQLSPAPDTMKS
jgi:type I restriction enzyme S subunit